MTIRLTDGQSVSASKVGTWFVVGFALATLAFNTRGIAGLVHYLV